MKNDLELARIYVAKAASAKDRGIEFTMSFTCFKNLMRAKRCYYTKELFVNDKGHHRKRTIDRIDNKKGYVHGNVVACSNKINAIKNTWESQNVSLADLEKLIKKIKKSM